MILITLSLLFSQQTHLMCLLGVVKEETPDLQTENILSLKGVFFWFPVLFPLNSFLLGRYSPFTPLLVLFVPLQTRSLPGLYHKLGPWRYACCIDRVSGAHLKMF